MEPILLDIPDELIEEDLILRPYADGDGKAFFDLLQENKDHLADTVEEMKTIKTNEDAEIRNRRLKVNWIERKRFVMGIWDKSTLIGEIWIEPLDWKVPVIEIGYFVVKKHEGKGIVTRSVQLCLDFMFNKLNAHRVEIRTNDDNHRSFKVAERCGFTKEAHLRENTKLNDKIVGRQFYGLLKSEYEKINPKV